MLTVPRTSRLLIATAPPTFAGATTAPAALVEGQFGCQVRSGDLFVFINRRATQVRTLLWDRDAYCIVMKRLGARELALLLAGIDAPVIKRRER